MSEARLNERRRELFIRKTTRTAASTLRRVQAFPHTPAALAPFCEVLENVHIRRQDVPRPAGEKSVGALCAMVPGELIAAAGALPLRLCSGNFTAYAIGDEDVPRDACPLVKAVAGAVATGVFPAIQNCDLLLLPVTCDCKKKLAGMLEREKPTQILQLPTTKTQDAELSAYLSQLYLCKTRLEALTGQAITASRLRACIEDVGYAQYELSRLLSLRRLSPPLLRGTHAMVVMNAYAYMPVRTWSACVRDLCDALAREKTAVARANQPRILITGSPIVFPNLKLPLLIEEMGGLLAADETCLGDRSLSDPVIVTDDSLHGLLRALAQRYTRPCTCPVFSDNRQRLTRLRQLIQVHRIQGVVYHVLRGCLVYDYEYLAVEAEMERLGIPILRVETDYNEEDVEQLRIRIEAFVELIKLRGEAHDRT